MTHCRAVRFLRADMPALSTNVRFRVISALATEPNGGLIAIASPLVTQKRDLIVSLTNRSRLPILRSVTMLRLEVLRLTASTILTCCAVLSPLLALSGHRFGVLSCPLLDVKRTWVAITTREVPDDRF